MRVLHVAPAHARRFGGPSEVLRGLLPQLQKRGVEVAVLTTDKGHAHDDDDFLSIAPRVEMARSRPPASLNYATGLLPLLRELTNWAEIVHVHSVHTYVSTAAMTMARSGRTPVMLQPHGAFDSYHLAESAWRKNLYSAAFDRWGLKSVAGVVYSSEREADDGRRHLARPAHSIPLGVEESLFSIDRRPSTDRFEVLYLGRIAAKKRLDLVLSAFAESTLLRSKARLTIAGPADATWAFDPQRFVAENRLGDSVEFLGTVVSAERRSLLTRASAFVLPSEDESFGVAVAEAMAAGVPVVASSEVGLVPAAMRRGAVRECRVNARSVRTILEELVGQPDEAARIGAAGRLYAAEHFTWDASSRALMTAYHAVLVEHAKRRSMRQRTE